MNELQIFNYQDNEIRTIEKEDGVWWVLKDVCQALGMDTAQLKKVADRLEEDEKGRNLIPTPGGNQESWIINESGLYNVIIRSDKPEAVPFRRWVTHEVLPSIRKHGAYMTPETLEKVLCSPDTIIQIATALKQEQEKSKALEAVNSSLTVENQIMAPKAEYFDELVDRNLLTNFRETAKQLDVPPKRFVSFLLDRKYISRDKRGRLMPYAQHVENGLFEVKESVNEKTRWSGTQTLITPKGRETFRLLYLKIA